MNLRFDFTACVHVMLIIWPPSLGQNSFHCCACHLPCEKACHPLRPSNQRSCYSSMNRADVCDQPPRCVVETECKCACQCSDSRLTLPPPCLWPMLLHSLNQCPSQGTVIHSACAESEFGNCGPVRKVTEKSKNLSMTTWRWQESHFLETCWRMNYLFLEEYVNKCKCM